MSRLTRGEILGWLHEEDEKKLQELYQRADAVRREHVGEMVHLRGLIEISNHCVRQCGYCGLRAGNRTVDRYRMTPDEIVACARKAKTFGYGTVVLQGGEDPAMTAELMSDVVRRIKADTGLAVTLSLGERPEAELVQLKEAGADRYLLRFETSDPELYQLIHPGRPGVLSDRVEMLRRMRKIGFQIGGGVMIGIPGQTWETIADDIQLFEALDLDMIGVGPFLPHPETPLGKGEWTRPVAPEAQVPSTEKMTYKVVALTRLSCPEANIPSTTALATLNKEHGREQALAAGANVVMPNLTPLEYRTRYEIYPGKACMQETAEVCHGCLLLRLSVIGRKPGLGPGHRARHEA
jgi:biotin synthase